MNLVAETTFSPASRPLISRGRPYTPAPASPAGKPFLAASRGGQKRTRLLELHLVPLRDPSFVRLRLPPSPTGKPFAVASREGENEIGC